MKVKKTVFFLTVAAFFAVFPAKASFVTVKSVDAPEKFALYDEPKAGPTAVFYDAANEPVGLKNFAGKIVLVNVWSTACSQCVVELPMLDALQKSFGTVRFVVVPLSVGGETPGAVTRFFIQKQFKNLRAYVDKNAAFSMAAGVTGLPTTLLFDARGREIGRIRGIAEWTGPVVKAQIRSLIKAEIERQKEEKKQREAAATTPIPLIDEKNDLPSPADVSGWFKK